MIGDILQPTHLLFVLVIALLVLGPKRLPETARSLGRGLRDFRNALSGTEHDDLLNTHSTDSSTVTPPPPVDTPEHVTTTTQPLTAAEAVTTVEHAEATAIAEPATATATPEPVPASAAAGTAPAEPEPTHADDAAATAVHTPVAAEQATAEHPQPAKS